MKHAIQASDGRKFVSGRSVVSRNMREDLRLVVANTNISMLIIITKDSWASEKVKQLL